MKTKTQRELIRELHQGIYGVPDTEDKGMVGDLKDLVEEIKKMNGRVSRNSRLVFIIIGALIGTGILGGLEIASVTHLMGG